MATDRDTRDADVLASAAAAYSRARAAEHSATIRLVKAGQPIRQLAEFQAATIRAALELADHLVLQLEQAGLATALRAKYSEKVSTGPTYTVQGPDGRAQRIAIRRENAGPYARPAKRTPGGGGNP